MLSYTVERVRPTTMGDLQHFCLRWNNYQTSITTAIENLRGDEDFIDVSLACDGKIVKAHKVVLSACSPYFRELLKSTPCKHPVIVLQDVVFDDLHALVEFIYHGEVNVHQRNLSSFLKTAEVLKVSGLTQQNSAANSPPSSSPSSSPSCDPPLPTRFMAGSPNTALEKGNLFQPSIFSSIITNPNEDRNSPQANNPLSRHRIRHIPSPNPRSSNSRDVSPAPAEKHAKSADNHSPPLYGCPTSDSPAALFADEKSGRLARNGSYDGSPAASRRNSPHSGDDDHQQHTADDEPEGCDEPTNLSTGDRAAGRDDRPVKVEPMDLVTGGHNNNNNENDDDKEPFDDSSSIERFSDHSPTPVNPFPAGFIDPSGNQMWSPAWSTLFNGLGHHPNASNLGPGVIDGPSQGLLLPPPPITGSINEPQDCPHCNRTFSCYYSLKRHFHDKHEHRNTLYVCEFCHRRYRTKNSLTTHKSLQHRGSAGILKRLIRSTSGHISQPFAQEFQSTSLLFQSRLHYYSKV